MATTLTWAVIQMNCYPQDGAHTDVVFNVHWTLTGTDGTYTSSVYGSQAVGLDPDAPFTPYDKLTENLVLNWVWDAMGDEQVRAYEDNVEGSIFTQANPPVVTPPLPWA